MLRVNPVNSGNDMMRERFFVDIPPTDILFFELFADKMGWKVNKKQALWDEYIKSSPQNVNLSEEEILEEVRAVRYAKVQDNC